MHQYVEQDLHHVLLDGAPFSCLSQVCTLVVLVSMNELAIPIPIPIPVGTPIGTPTVPVPVLVPALVPNM
jgi:hypothetical protein